MRRNIRRGRGHVTRVMAAVILAPVMAGLIAAQGGDQFLDGIGETALVARYLFNGNAEDSSRNHFHATLVGSGAAYVEDARFGRALELAGNGSHVQLPGERSQPGRTRSASRAGSTCRPAPPGPSSTSGRARRAGCSPP